eukprot:m.169752 g.169752  ORF g.169752 m.169752 type:complete len:87 (-) comp15271_c0_seq53:998-1258(-)
MHAAKAPAPSRRNSEPVYSTADVHVRLQNILMQLRKVCNHPYLVEYPLTRIQITEAVLDAALDRSVTDSDAAAAACESDVEHSGPP